MFKSEISWNFTTSIEKVKILYFPIFFTTTTTTAQIHITMQFLAGGEIRR